MPLSLNVSAVDYDSATDSLVSNYIAPLSVARSLNYPVVTPVNSNDGLELQHLNLSNDYLAALTGNPSLNLFDGPEFSKTFTKYNNLLSVEELGRLYQDLLASSDAAPASIEDAVELAFNNLNRLAGTSYSHFDYIGSKNPETVFVIYGSHESTQLSHAISKLSSDVGLLKVRVPLPFSSAKFVQLIPSSTRKLVVLGQGSTECSRSSSLKGDITAALFLSGHYHNLSVDEFVYPLNFVWTPITITKILSEFLPSLNVDQILAVPDRIISSSPITANTSPEGGYLLWGKDNGTFIDVSNKLALTLSLDDSKVVSIRNKFDNINGGGLFENPKLSRHQKVYLLILLILLMWSSIEDISILSSYDILATAKPGATILLVNHKPIKNSVEEDIIPKLPVEFRRTLAKNHNQLVLVDNTILDDLDALNDSTKGFSGDFLVQLAFWRESLPELDGFIVNKLVTRQW